MLAYVKLNPTVSTTEISQVEKFGNLLEHAFPEFCKNVFEEVFTVQQYCSNVL
jgi:hypothetical protein